MALTCTGDPWKNNNDNLLHSLFEEHISEFEQSSPKETIWIYAEILESLAEGRLSYSDNKDSFLCFSRQSGNWEAVSNRQMIRMARSAIKKINDCIPIVRDRVKLKDGHTVCIIKHTDTALVKKVIEELKINMSGSEDTQPQKGVIHVINGFLEPESNEGQSGWKLIPNEEGMCFHSRNSFNAEYIPDAVCPKWLAFLNACGLNPEDQSLLQKYCGMVLLGLGNRAQLILLIYGPGGMGKSTFVKILLLIIGGDNAASLHGDSFGSRFDLARYPEKLCLVGMDLPKNFLVKRGGMLKALTGDDYLQGSFHSSDREVGFHGNLPVVLTSNDSLRLKLGGKNDISAYRRRLAPIPFSTIGNARTANNPYLFEELKEEASGILNWMLDGALTVFYSGGSITLGAEQLQRVEAILNESNTAEEFVETCVEVGKEEESLTVRNLTDAYFEFCIMHEWEPLSERIAFRKIKEAIIRKYQLRLRHDVESNNNTGKDTSQRGFKGLRLKQNNEQIGDKNVKINQHGHHSYSE